MKLYAHALLEKNYADTVNIFVTTRAKISGGDKNSLWEKV